MVVGTGGYLGEERRALRLTNDLVLPAIRAPAPGPLGLTSAQREVLLLAAEGLTNAAIGVRRNSSQHTVANLLAAAYAKLGITGRRELRARLSLGG
jgi:DNA-binding CsgD family transcriptional regulator